jgi:hypothetical protein
MLGLVTYGPYSPVLAPSNEGKEASLKIFYLMVGHIFQSQYRREETLNWFRWEDLSSRTYTSTKRSLMPINLFALIFIHMSH